MLDCALLFGRLTTVMALALVVGLAAGCASRKDQNAGPKPPPAFTVKAPGSNTNLVITPASSLVGRVASVNSQANIVVLSFPIGQLPENGARFSLFRAGAKVGEIKISGPTAETFTVGDITAGSAQEGDEVRAE
jgi:hypothetical protein